MRWVILVLFVSLPIVGIFAAWQARCLLAGRPAVVTKNLRGLSPERMLHARRDYAHFSLAVSVAMLFLPAAALLLRWPHHIWGNVLAIVGGVAVIWGWLLTRRYANSA